MENALLSVLAVFWREPHWVVGAVAGTCVLRAIWIALFYRPAKARLVADGYRVARRDRDAAIFLGERAPMPLTVEDEVVFTVDEARTVRATVRRWAEPRDGSSLIWYLPRRPERVSGAGPIRWLGFGMLALSTLLVLG